MSSIKIVLRKKRDKNGRLPDVHPLALRITKDRRSSFVFLGYSIKEADWNAKAQAVKSSHPNHTRLNNFLLKKRVEANNHALEMDEKVSSKAVKQKIKPKAGITFFAQAQVYLDSLKVSGKYNQYSPDQSRLRTFKKFTQQDIAFSDITVSLLERFKVYLRGTYDISERTVINHLVSIRSVFSHAIKEQAVDPKYYPFGKGKINIKFPESKKIGLTQQEVAAIENLNLLDKFQNHVRNLWLFSFYFAGMRVSDVLRMRWTDIQDDRLHYSMGKNNKGGSLKIPVKAAKIIEQYAEFRQNKDDLIFPELKECNFDDKFITQRTIAFKTSAIDKCLRNYIAPAAGIEKPLTMHIARHTFGNLSGDKIPIQMLQKLYRHSSVVTTIGYQQNFIHKEADEALDAIVVFGP